MSHPLLCWDIVLEGQMRRREFEDDITAIGRIAAQNQWNFCYPRTLANCIVWENKVIVITDPSLSIVLVTRNILGMNGYTAREVTGHTPGIFQGDATTEEEKQPIRQAIRNLQPFDEVITNYRKDGSRYRCRIEGYPVFNTTGMLVNFIAFENVYHE